MKATVDARRRAVGRDQDLPAGNGRLGGPTTTKATWGTVLTQFRQRAVGVELHPLDPVRDSPV
jgi:hypothetical protein